jgi:hypothetical protein
MAAVWELDELDERRRRNRMPTLKQGARSSLPVALPAAASIATLGFAGRRGDREPMPAPQRAGSLAA